ncbi:MAG: hypothetical protein OEV41_12600, partial [Gammaproteobacteria bacterium]|nr:hypothetical protein [Gammaproteobacteria bacterium]
FAWSQPGTSIAKMRRSLAEIFLVITAAPDGGDRDLNLPDRQRQSHDMQQQVSGTVIGRNGA